MKVEMLMPQMGESITEATISKWLKKVGDAVKRDEILLEISTDKVDSEIPAPATGIIAEILFEEGQVVPVKTKIAVIDSTGSALQKGGELSKPNSQDSTSNHQEIAGPEGSALQAKELASQQNESLPRVNEQLGDHASSGTQSRTGTESTIKTNKFFSPLVKSLASKFGLSSEQLESIVGSGQGGRVTKDDLLTFVNSVRSPSMDVATTLQTAKPASNDKTAEASWNNERVKIVPMDNMRKAIAEHMLRSKRTSPHVYSVQEIDINAVSRWRKKHKEEFRRNEGFSLSYTPFFLEAAVKALQNFPYINASVDGNSILLKKDINLGCAVALANFGLIVPVIRRAEEKNLVGLARSLNDLATRARNKKLLPDDVTDGTFTVTNPGVFGTLIGTPIINQPQVAILCLGVIEKRPVVIQDEREDDMIAIRERCYLTLSYDHRIVDGSLGGQFLAFIREYLEGWSFSKTLY